MAAKHMKSSNTFWHRASVTRERREKLNGHLSATLWFTGLSCSGKSTLAHAVEAKLHDMGCRTFVLDGDNVRYGLCSDLGFSRQDRAENIRRIGEIVSLFMQAGVIVLAAFISPFRHDRERVRSLLSGDFLEIYCRCPVEICEQRDSKGIYRLARKGDIKEFTGISSPYEEPEYPEVIIDTAATDIDDSVGRIMNLLVEKKIIGR